MCPVFDQISVAKDKEELFKKVFTYV
jgi:hypothetical protein